MKLKILKDFGLAKPNPAAPHWKFKKDQLIETDNEHLIDRLLHYKAADIIEKEPKKEKKAKAHRTPKNKMHEPTKEDK